MSVAKPWMDGSPEPPTSHSEDGLPGSAFSVVIESPNSSATAAIRPVRFAGGGAAGVGRRDASTDGVPDGSVVGSTLEATDGSGDGSTLGRDDGGTDGSPEGSGLGVGVGGTEGSVVGVGLAFGAALGFAAATGATAISEATSNKLWNATNSRRTARL